MPDVNALFADYASYHRTKGNKVFHRLGIPLLMLSLLGMLARIALPGVRFVDAATVLIALSTLYYLVVEWRLAIAMLIVSVVFYLAGAWLPLWVNVALFVAGVICQYVGHKVYEHRQPAFMKNMAHLLIGPLWILNDFVPLVKA
jgi:uncharacterized membrane protein YGL010W